MDRSEKLRLSADGTCGYTFRHGPFLRLYERSLYWFVHHIKPLKPMLEKVKGGEPLIYGGLPVRSFEKLLEEGGLCAEATENGWKWQYAEQTQGADEDFSGLSVWREAALIAVPQQPNSSTRDILHEIRTFNLAGSTPMQTLSTVADWQAFLHNGEGAG